MTEPFYPTRLVSGGHVTFFRYDCDTHIDQLPEDFFDPAGDVFVTGDLLFVVGRVQGAQLSSGGLFVVTVLEDEMGAAEGVRLQPVAPVQLMRVCQENGGSE